MARKPQRIIEATLIEGIGPITARDLLAMPEDSWGLLRGRITDRRHGKDGLVARCMACEGEVYIRTARLGGTSRPLFAHYSGRDPDCPWHHGRNAMPDDACAAQYQGCQESTFHRLMCEKIAELVALDERHIRHTIAEYLPPTENAHGRYPDTYVEWRASAPSQLNSSCRAPSRRRFQRAAKTMSTRGFRCSGSCSAWTPPPTFNRAFTM